MAEIKVVRGADKALLDKEGVFDWPVWSHEAAEFPWSYDEAETCYFLAGEVTVTPEHGEPVTMGQGDMATFPGGMNCTWKITKDVRKHYRFG